jgi:hypothetical protein
MASKTSISGLDPLKELFETILVRLEALESKVGGGALNSGGSLSAGSSHGKPHPAAKASKRLSVVHGEYSILFVDRCGVLFLLKSCWDTCI